MGLTWPEVLARLSRREPLSAAEAEETLKIVLAGQATPVQVGAFLTLLHAKGETAEEVTGLARAMVDAAVPCPLAGQDAETAVDLVGTGGDRLSSINVTTLAAFITAGCGVPVCKHGNRAASSSVGTADVLEALGVAVDLGPAGVARCVEEIGFGFCFAPRFHPAMRFAGPVRAELGVPTVFNFLGPLANPAHYFIIIGLFGVFLAGAISVVLPFDKPGPAAVRITRNWYAPVGGLLMAGCGMYAMTGFPLDDIWHRIFGQDVTLWGPTHLMMIGGANFSLFAVLMLEYEGVRSLPEHTPAEGELERKDGPFIRTLRYLSCGGLLIGMSVYQIEFDFGVPQFRLVFQPMLIAAAAADAGPGRRVAWLPSFEVARSFLSADLREGDLCLVMGAGDVDKLARSLVA